MFSRCTHRLAALAFALSSAAAAQAAVIDGRIGFPGDDAPPVTVYVYSLDAARLRNAAIQASRRDFRIEVPAGRYLVFAAPSDPGAPDVYGAYTQCDSVAAKPLTTPCADHSLRTVVIGPGARRATVTIDDWSLSDADADALDRIRGIAATPGPEPRGAPHFSEYPVAADPSPEAARARPRLGALHLSPADRRRARDVLAAGANFAGGLTVLVAHCGSHCLRVLLIDSGKAEIVEPPELGAIDDSLPCRTAEAVLFRRDSRLLSVTRWRDGVIVTQYFVWEPRARALTLLAAYPRKPAQYCAIDPP
ncbi:MAG: hypothetical protein KGL34_13770 [Gammaproteobacteria bacterium]|nr:hypothetical protein [Gammaproteobacteria bacterium]